MSPSLPADRSPGAFAPYADDVAVLTVDALTVENGTDSIVVSGSLEIPRDAAGLERARVLRALLAEIVRAIEAGGARPASGPEGLGNDSVDNPFS